ncbi:MAG TPA: glycosyltransferase family 4 protein [Vicinamibacterales bacterium]|nr:glycosyltransferase family 4 protein [Vicinamibacterales bacterium]
MPPLRTGVAACSRDLVARLSDGFHLDVFVDEAQPGGDARERPAHEFVWRQRRQRYDLVVYQVGNSAHHEFVWPYLFRYPGLLVLHDARLHHARAAALLRANRAGDYRAEFAASHPDLSPDLAELAVRGFDNALYYRWPMTRLAVRASRTTAVHSRYLADELRAENPGAHVELIRLGHGSPEAAPDARPKIRARYGIADDAVVFGCFGGLSPEKRLPQVLRAFARLRARLPAVHLLLVGAEAAHAPLTGEIARAGLDGSVTRTGYVDDEALSSCLAATDVGVMLRWPTAREISGPWLRCLALGLPTITVRLRQLLEVPALDPRTWQPFARAGGDLPVTVAVDILDEDHSLGLAMQRLAVDGRLRESVGRAASEYWARHHSPDAMAEDYRRVMGQAIARPDPEPPLPPHLINDGDRRLGRLLEPFGLSSPLG